MSKTGNSASRARHRQAKKGTAINYKKKKSVAEKRASRLARTK